MRFAGGSGELRPGTRLAAEKENAVENTNSAQWAEKLWSDLHDALTDTQNAIIAIIKSRAWEPIGYGSFHEAWKDRMSDIKIASHILPHVIYQMFDEGQTGLTAECSNQGLVRQTPLTGTRTGDVPPTVIVADPAAVPPASPSPAVPGPVLDGTFRMEYDYAHETVDGGLVDSTSSKQTHWFAFRSLCTSKECVAAGAMLDDESHQPTGQAGWIFHFTDGRWQQEAPYLMGPTSSCPALGSWSWEPQPDGTLRGVATSTDLTNDCGQQGAVHRTPMVITRMGDVPPSVITADPALFMK